MHKLTVTLKQHTPLIHFQHDQEGATLRASEVKPKLDKFIVTKLGSNATPEEIEKGTQEWEDYKASFNKGKNEQDKENRSFDDLDFYKRGTLIAKALGWLVGKGDHPALDYKMRIVARKRTKEYLIASLLSTENLSNIPEGVEIISNSPYFAQEEANGKIIYVTEETKHLANKKNKKREWNEEEWDNIDKKGLEWEDISISIFSLNSELLSIVKKNIASFFICTNFGSRSTKGFGSFTVSQINGKNFDIDIKSALTENFRFSYEKECGGGLSKIFKTIKEDYQIIKSGVNYPRTSNFDGKYIKSILFCYAAEKMKGENVNGVRWEKRFFKQQMKDKLGNDSLKYEKEPIQDASGKMSWNDPQDGYDYKYLRSVLGVAEQYEFLLKDIWDDRGKKYKQNPIKAKVKVKSQDQGIERYESPILFKVIDNTIYIVGNDVDANMLGKNFNFSFTKGNSKVIEDKPLQSPTEFDLSDFIAYAMDKRFNLGYTKIK